MFKNLKLALKVVFTFFRMANCSPGWWKQVKFPLKVEQKHRKTNPAKWAIGLSMLSINRKENCSFIPGKLC